MVTVSCRVLVLAVALTLTATSGLAQTAKDVGRQHKSSMLHFLAASSPVSQNKNPSQGTEDGRSLPNITILMHEVAEQQKAAEAIEKDYLYHAIDIVQEVDRHGKVKRAVTKEYDVFWLEGVPVHKLTRKDGRTLSPEEQKKQSEEIDRQVTKVREKRAKASAKGKETDPAGDETITVSRLLELGRFTNPRRVNLNGRDTIA